MEKKDAIDKMLQNLVNDYEKEISLDKESKEIKEVDSPSNLDGLSKIILNKVEANDAVAKEIYDLFYGDLAVGRDRSDSSKDALLRSLELKVESSRVLAELAKSIARKEQTNSGNVGVFFNAKSGKQYDVDIKNIQKELDDNDDEKDD